MSPNPAARTKILQTGLEGFDTIMGGGIPHGSLIMLVGEPGTGKTTLLQQLCFTWDSRGHSNYSDKGADLNPDSARLTVPSASSEGEDTGTEPEIPPQPTKAIYFSTLSEPHDKVIEHMRRFTFFDEAKLNTKIRFFSLTGVMAKENEAGNGNDREAGNAQEVGTFIIATARKEKASLVVVDGLGALLDSFNSLQDTRYFLNQLSSQLGTLGITSFLALEQAYLNSATNGLLTGADGIIGLYSKIQGAGEYHRVEVHKLRGMKRLEGRHTYRFNHNGLVFFPRLESQIDNEAGSGKELEALLEDATLFEKERPRLKFGLPELENMLNGGLPPESSTFVAGSPGAGKTLLSLHYLMQGVSEGEASLFVGFYEGARNLIRKAARFNLDLLGAIKSGKLKLMTIPAVELEPDQIAYRIKQVVEEYGIRRVVIDGVLELEIACRPDGRSRNYTSALDSYFKGKRIATLYTYTISKLIGPELDLSDTVFTVLAENLILLRQLAYQSRLYRVVSVLKMRDSIYDLAIREFTIENEVGISVLQPFQSDTSLLESLTHVLTDPPSDLTSGETNKGEPK
jgi:circadian clock protein KaiC